MVPCRRLGGDDVFNFVIYGDRTGWRAAGLKVARTGPVEDTTCSISIWYEVAI